MTDLRRTPSLQHAVALIRDTVPATLLEFEKLDAARIPFTLNPGRRMFKPLMEGQTLAWVVRQLRMDKNPKNIVPNVSLVEAFDAYARGKAVSWFRECEPHPYPIGGGIVIPVRPSGFWAEDGRLHVLWPQCWKTRTLDALQRAIFNTILRDTFFVGDFKNAELEWVDLREQKPRQGRGIEVLDGAALGTVSRGDLAGYLSILVAAFEQHTVAKDKRRTEAKSGQRQDKRMPLFDSYLGKDTA